MKYSPAAILGFVFLSASLIASKVSNTLDAILILISIIVMLLIIVFRKRLNKDLFLNIVFILSTVIIATLNFTVRDNITGNKINNLEGERRSISGYVKSESEYMYGRYYCIIDSSVYGTVRLSSKKDFNAKLYDVIKADVVFTDYENRQNCVDLGAYTLNDCRIIHQKSKDLTYYLLYLKKLAKEYIDSSVGENSGIVRGIVLGDKNAISKEINRNFKLAGLSHILVFSGIHFSTVIMFFTTLVRVLSSKRWILNVLTVIIDIAVMITVGFCPSVLRAGFASIAVVIASSMNTGSDSMTTLGLSVIFTGLFNPFALVNAGFILSFFACLGIGLFSKKLSFYIITRFSLYNIFVSKIIKAVSVTFSAQIAVIPILCIYFDSLSLVGVVSFLFISVVCDFLVIFTLISMLLAATGFLKGVGDFVMKIVNCFADYIKYIAATFAKMPLSDVKNPYYVSLSVALCLLAVLICLILYKYKKNVFKQTILICTVIFISVNLLGMNANKDLIRVCQTNSGEVIVSDDKNVILISQNSTNFALEQIENQINNLSSGSIDLFIPVNDKCATGVIANFKPKTVMSGYLTVKDSAVNYYDSKSASIGDVTVKLSEAGILVTYGNTKIAIVNERQDASDFNGSDVFIGKTLSGLKGAGIVITNGEYEDVKQLALLNNRVYNNEEYTMCVYLSKSGTALVRRD